MGQMGTHRPSYTVGRMLLKKAASFVLVSKASSMYPTMGKEPVSAGSGLGGWNGYACGVDFTSGLAEQPF
jgi:hypothetical protein